MTELLRKIKSELASGSIPNTYILQKSLKEISPEDQPRARAFLRLAQCIQEFQNDTAGIPDLLAILRQVIRYNNGSLLIHNSIMEPLQKLAGAFSLITEEISGDRGALQVSAVDWKNDQILDSASIDRLEYKRNFEQAPGNGTLYQMTQHLDQPFINYRYEGQQIAVEAALYAPPSSTTLVIIPTGGGKSMAIWLPAWIDTNGGGFDGGTTVVVVPTVALAYDQARNAREFFKGAPNRPRAWTSDTSTAERQEILNDLKIGRLPILYVSPEALLQPALREACLHAAVNGKLYRFVIDEAHIVESWGSGFRTEFQYLGAFCRQLNEQSNFQLRLLLLSATIPASTQSTLKTLFSLDNNAFNVIISNQLRPEISYYSVEHYGEQTRIETVLEALRHLPRPLILYVTKRDHANNWMRLLRRKGYQRIASFTGETPSNERQQRISEWNRNKIDIMVATSAFGMGVDKSDVRAIIHACVPESIDRYYQEVGRGGRDGYRAVSLLAYFTPKDQGIAESMNRSARITAERALDRWRAIWRERTRQSSDDDTWIINLDQKPDDITHDHDKTEQNRDWNHHIVLLMQRAGFIKIISPAILRDDESHHELIIQILDEKAVRDSDTFLHYFGKVRDDELTLINQQLEMMNQFLNYQQSKEYCVSRLFEEIYYPTARACGGCAKCRTSGVSTPTQTARTRIEIKSYPEPTAQYLSSEWQKRTTKNSLHILLSDTAESDLKKTLLQLLAWGHQQFILPAYFIQEAIQTDIKFIRSCSKYPGIPHHFMGYDRLKSETVFPLPTVILYPNTEQDADTVYQYWSRWQKRFNQQLWVTHIYEKSLYLPGQGGLFRDKINGHKEYVASFFDWAKETEMFL